MNEFIKNAQQAIIQTLYEQNAVKINVDEPYTLKGGVVSPVFCDTGILECKAETRGRVISAMVVQIHQYCNSIQSDTDAIVGVVSGGISWASGIANCDLIPVLRAHARPKDHGLHNQIDGELEKDGDKVIVVDDVLTSGSSVLSVVNALRKGKSNKKAEILAVYTILDWNLASTNKKFEEAGVKKVCLLTMEEVLDYGFEHSLIPIEYKPAIQSFMKEHL